MTPDRDAVLAILKTVQDPEIFKDIVTLNMVKDIAINGSQVTVSVELTTPACPMRDKIKNDVTAAVASLPGVTGVDVKFTANVRGAGQPKNLLPGVRNVIAVGAGKGGVGKSTMAVSIAAGLSLQGAKVGLLDGDVYGPSIPTMTGLERNLRRCGANRLCRFRSARRKIRCGSCQSVLLYPRKRRHDLAWPDGSWRDPAIPGTGSLGGTGLSCGRFAPRNR